MIANLLNMFTRCFNFVAPTLNTVAGMVLATGDELKDSETILNENSAQNFGQIAAGVQRIMEDIVGPIMMVIGAILAIFLIKIGIDYAKAEDANKRKEAMGRLIGIGVGLIIILVGISLCYVINWVDLYANMTGHRHTMVDTNPQDGFCDKCAQDASSIVHEAG